mmetsp:Transcript_33242/g.67987  ORF Transcript_33242/g.67987 Transcript_33242/m.67987 type:complete len:223 (+) Transcript_33242:447-1115(+)
MRHPLRLHLRCRRHRAHELVVAAVVPVLSTTTAPLWCPLLRRHLHCRHHRRRYPHRAKPTSEPFRFHHRLLGPLLSIPKWPSRHTHRLGRLDRIRCHLQLRRRCHLHHRSPLHLRPSHRRCQYSQLLPLLLLLAVAMVFAVTNRYISRIHRLRPHELTEEMCSPTQKYLPLLVVLAATRLHPCTPLPLLHFHHHHDSHPRRPLLPGTRHRRRCLARCPRTHT